MLYEWMDPRYLSTLVFPRRLTRSGSDPTYVALLACVAGERAYRYFAGSWYSSPIAERIAGAVSKADLDQRMDQINRFEAMLVNEGALVLKFWFHLSKKASASG